MQQPSALYLSVHSALPTILSKQALSCVQNLSAQKVLTETFNEQSCNWLDKLMQWNRKRGCVKNTAPCMCATSSDLFVVHCVGNNSTHVKVTA